VVHFDVLNRFENSFVRAVVVAETNDKDVSAFPANVGRNQVDPAALSAFARESLGDLLAEIQFSLLPLVRRELLFHDIYCAKNVLEALKIVNLS
jgi:hypothetical protein